MAWKFVSGANQAGSSTWWLYGANGELTAWSGETFASASNATRAAQAFKAGSATARYEVYQDSANEWRWRAWRSSDKVAASGESFASQYNAQRAAEAVRGNAPYATGP